jgi:hypothetical protein
MITKAFDPDTYKFRKSKEQIESDFNALGYESIEDYKKTKKIYNLIAARFEREPMPNYCDISCQSVDESVEDIFKRCEHVQKEVILEKIKRFRQESVKNILGEIQQTTANDSHKAKAKTGRKKGEKIHNETKELLYVFWVKHGRLGSGEFESLIKRKLSNNSVIDGLILVFDDNLPFTSKNEAIGYKAEFDKKNLVFSGLAKMISSDFRKR